MNVVVALVLGALLVSPHPAEGVSGETRSSDAAVAEVSWGVAPIREPGGGSLRPNFVLAAEPGGVVRDLMTVTNFGDQDLELGIYASDAFNTPDGETDLLPRDEDPVDLGAWITPDVVSLEVPAGTSAQVPFQVTVPEDAAPGDHVAGLVTSLTIDDDEAGEVRVERRLGVRVFMRVGGPLRPELTFRSLGVDYDRGWNPFAPGRMTLRYEVENTGNVRLRARRVAAADGALAASASAEGADMPELLPGNSYELSQELTDVWPAFGTDVSVTLEPYDPIAESSQRAPAPVVATTRTTLWPTGLALVVGLVLVGAVSMLLARRRNRGARIPKKVG